jgi:heptosyltransferase-2
MTTPALQRIRQRYPQAHITLLTDQKLGDLWRSYPGLDTVITFNRTDNPWAIARRLRDHHFEAALILPSSPRSAFEAWLAGIPQRIGYAARWRSWFLTYPVSYPSDRLRLRKLPVREVKRLVRLAAPRRGIIGAAPHVHQTFDYLHLAACLGADSSPLAPKLEMTAEETQAVLASCLSRAGAPDALKFSAQPGLRLGLNPSAAYGPAKCWPIEKFAEVTQQISRQLPKCSWLIFGDRKDADCCETLATLGAGRFINFAGKTSLRELMALLKSCHVLLTNDSGPMHLAAALGTPVVAVFGSTSPELTGPGQPGDRRHRILRSNAYCSPCFRRTCPIDFRCMNGITANQAVTAILELVSSKFGLDDR